MTISHDDITVKNPRFSTFKDDPLREPIRAEIVELTAAYLSSGGVIDVIPTGVGISAEKRSEIIATETKAPGNGLTHNNQTANQRRRRASADPDLLSLTEVSSMYGVPRTTLSKHVARGTGPKLHSQSHCGREVRRLFKRSDVLVWVESLRGGQDA